MQWRKITALMKRENNQNQSRRDNDDIISRQLLEATVTVFYMVRSQKIHDKHRHKQRYKIA